MSDTRTDGPPVFRPEPLTPLPVDAHKGDAGRLLCACGSFTMPGAAILVARAAQRAGAGLVTLSCLDQRLIGTVAAAAPEAIYLDLSTSRELLVGRLPSELRGRLDHARVAGPGLGQDSLANELVRRLVDDAFEGPFVLDASGLGVAGDTPEVLSAYGGPLVLTPHPGEASRLLGRTVPGDESGRVAAAVEISLRADAICCLKGHRTIIARGDRVAVVDTGNEGLATAGTGDVLAGILGAYLARWSARRDDEALLFDVVATAAYVHGLAGDLATDELGARAVVASDLIEFLPDAQRIVDGELSELDDDDHDDDEGEPSAVAADSPAGSVQQSASPSGR